MPGEHSNARSRYHSRMSGSGTHVSKRAAAILGLASLVTACATSRYDGGPTGFRDCPYCPAMVVVPAGTFIMGSPPAESDRGADEGPARPITFAAPFAIGRYEVTRGEFGAFVQATGYLMNKRCLVWDGSQLAPVDGKSWLDPNYAQTDDHPVVCVSWRDAAAYAQWLAARTGLPYRLPSEAEWEYAARGGTQTAYAFPGSAAEACNYGNVSDRRAREEVPQWNQVDCDDGVGLGTAAVGSYRANGYGLHDTMGNVWEWVADCYHDNYAGAPRDGSAWKQAGTCGTALDRGGGFSNVFPGHLRAANRSRAPSPDVAVYSLGFRVARDLKPGEPFAQQ